MGCRGGFLPPSGEANSPLQRQVDHRSRALFGRSPHPRRLPPSAGGMSMGVSSIVTTGRQNRNGGPPNCPNYSPPGSGGGQGVVKPAWRGPPLCVRGFSVLVAICETRAFPGAVIPAKAGIYSASHWKCVADGLDSRSPPSRGQASRE